MAKNSKQSGYLVKIEAFVPFDLTDNRALVLLQESCARAVKDIGNDAKATILPTRR